MLCIGRRSVFRKPIDNRHRLLQRTDSNRRHSSFHNLLTTNPIITRHRPLPTRTHLRVRLTHLPPRAERLPQQILQSPQLLAVLRTPFPINAVSLQLQLEYPEPPNPQHRSDPILIRRESQFLSSSTQSHPQGLETWHLRSHRLPHTAPVADEIPESGAAGHVGPEWRETFGKHVDVHVGDQGETRGAYTFGEPHERLEVRAGLYGERVRGVEDVDRFVVYGSAGLEKTQFVNSCIFLDGPIRSVGMIAAVQSPFAAIVHDSGLVRGVVEMDDFIPENVYIDHAADFVRKFCEEGAALRPWLAGAWSRKVSEFSRSFREGWRDCRFLVLYSSVQYDRTHDRCLCWKVEVSP